MKILHVLDHSIPLHSGYAFRTRAIIDQQRARGWDTCHVTSPKHREYTGPEEEVDGLRFFRTAGPNGLAHLLPGIREVAITKALEARLSEVAKREKPDVLHAHSPSLNGIAALRVGRRLGLPVVYEVRAFWEDAAVDHGTSREGGLRYRLSRTLETYVLRRADAVTTICEGLRSEIVGRGISPEKVTVIPNAVDLEQFEMKSAGEKGLEAGIGLSGKRVLGFIGSFYAYEGLSLLLEACPAIAKQVPNAHVLLVGGGPEETRLKAFASDLDIEGMVTFTGRVPHERVQAYYDLIDVFVYPRRSMRLTELVTPLKPLEAMARGRPVIASDVGGHRELIRHGETGTLFRADDVNALLAAVVELLGDEARWHGLRAAGRRFVESDRNWAAATLPYAAVYEAARQRVR